MEVAILVGIQASGKTSFYAARLLHTHVRVSLDLVRTRHREGELFATCLRLGIPVVVDNTNLTAAERAPLIASGRQAGYRVIGYYFQSRLAECLPRNAAREGKARIPEAGVLGAAGRLEVPALAEGFDVLHYVRMSEGGFVVEEWRDEVR